LTQTQRDRLRAAVQDFGLDTTQFAASSTVRDVLKALADVMPIAIVMHGETL
jgi:ribosome maturation protein Sdo1